MTILTSFTHLKLVAVSISMAIFAIVMIATPVWATENNRPDKVPGGQASIEQSKPHIVFLVNEDPNNYEAHRTIPPFADMLESKHGYQTTVIEAKGELPGLQFPGIEVLSEADLLVVFFRRAALPFAQLNAIKGYLDSGKPLVGIRTANHAFSVRNEEEIPEGYEDWWDFVPDILGSKNRGYGLVDPGTNVAVVLEAKGHPILKGFEPSRWHSQGNVYLTAPLLDKQATVLLTGKVEDKVEPIAWTRMAGASRVFYTSLGHPTDFDVPQFRALLVNGIRWALE